MKKKSLIIAAGLIGAMVGVSDTKKLSAEVQMEKCWGVVKAGKNDCGSRKEGHSCAGDGVDPKYNWIALPKGICERLVNGRLNEELHEED